MAVVCSPTVLEARHLKFGCGQGHTPSRGPGEDALPPQLLAAVGILWLLAVSLSPLAFSVFLKLPLSLL